MTKLRDVVTVRGGGTPRRSTPEFYGGSIPWVTPKDMKQGVIHDSSVRLTQAGVDNSPAKLIAPGSVLVVVRSGVLKHTLPVALTTAPVTLNQDMKALTPSDEVHPGFLARLIKSLQPLVLSWVRATTADNFPIENLLDLDVQIPPLGEQRRIAAVLDQADALRDKRRRALAHLDSLARAIFLDMFGELDATETVEAVAMQLRTGPFGSQLLHSEFVDDGIAVLGLDNVVRNEFRWGDRRYITPEKYQQLRRYTVHPGDVLISIMGTTGRCVVVPQDIPVAINTKHICAVTPDRSRVDPAFLRAAFMWHADSRAHLRRQTKGSIMDGLNMGIIKAMPLPVPSMRDQLMFGTRVEAADAQRQKLRRALAADEQLYASVQSRAFAGLL